MTTATYSVHFSKSAVTWKPRRSPGDSSQNTRRHQIYITACEVLWAKGHLDEAEIAFKEASSGRSNDWLTAELNLGIAAFERGRRTEAMQRFDRFIDFYNNGEATTSGDLTAVGIACQYLGISDSTLYQDALKAFDDAEAADPNDLRPRILTGNLF